jgi:hypothetical protein
MYSLKKEVKLLEFSATNVAAHTVVGGPYGRGRPIWPWGDPYGRVVAHMAVGRPVRPRAAHTAAGVASSLGNENENNQHTFLKSVHYLRLKNTGKVNQTSKGSLKETVKREK